MKCVIISRNYPPNNAITGISAKELVDFLEKKKHRY